MNLSCCWFASVVILLRFKCCKIVHSSPFFFSLNTYNSAFFQAAIAAISQFYRGNTCMVTIRLSRTGAKKKPFYHIVVIDSRKKRDGRSIERVGFFNPCALGQEETLRIDMERINHWVSLGAQTSDRVTKLINENAKAAA